MRLKGKIALITAAGQGIGEATARAFAAEGATVYATDVNAALLKKIRRRSQYPCVGIGCIEQRSHTSSGRQNPTYRYCF